MNPTGSWLAQDIERNVKFEVGFMPFPAPHGPGIFSGGLGVGHVHARRRQHADAAIKFLDYGMTAGAREVGGGEAAGHPGLPGRHGRHRATTRCSQQVLDDTAKIADGTGDFGYNIDVLTTDAFNNAMWKGMQGIAQRTRDAREGRRRSCRRAYRGVEEVQPAVAHGRSPRRRR